MTNYKRMLAPPGFTRRVDVPNEMVNDKLADGYKIDDALDERPELHSSTPNRHKGQAALVCASGPSMASYALETIYEFARELECVVWGTNNVFNVCDGRALPCDYVVVLDDAFWIGYRDKLQEYFNRFPRALPCLHFDPLETIKYQSVLIQTNRTPDTDPPYERNVYFHGNSSGVAAVQMAMHCGCDPIFLLGHDCTTKNGRTHGHGVRSQGELEQNYPQGLNMLSGYAILAKHARDLGVRVFNLSPVSALNDFERFDLGDTAWRRRFKRHGARAGS